MKSLIFAWACLVAATANAECIRWRGQHLPITVDGPGSWGPLQDTVTLDCLSYVGSLMRNGIEHVLVRDEKGTVYRLKVGDFMGEKTGRIAKIDESYIYIEQYGGNDVPTTTVRFRKTLPK